MAGQDEQPDDEVAIDEGGPMAGKRLAAARRDKQISVVEIAKELHLDETKVRALERNEFEALGAAVFAKGHLRKYAELVDVDLDDVMTDYYQLTRGESPPPIVVGRSTPRREMSPGPWIVVVAVFLVFAAAYWWFGVRSPASSPPPSSPAQQTLPDVPPAGADEETTDLSDVQPAAMESTPAVEPADEPGEPADPEPATTADTPVAEADTAPAVEPEVAAVEPLRLSITFTGDCWTEISDANGRRLYFGMGRDGQAVDLMGPAPVSVLFGNGSNVSLFVDGASYSLPPVDPSNQTIRLSIDKPR